MIVIFEHRAEHTVCVVCLAKEAEVVTCFVSDEKEMAEMQRSWF